MLQLGGGKAKTSKNFEIRLDNPFVVFHGDAHEAEPVEVTGTVYLSNTDHINFKSIKIRLEGKWKVAWYVEPGVSSMQIKEKGTVISEELDLNRMEGAGATNLTHKLAPGIHEWRFKFTLDPSLPESVEGLSGSFVVYDLRAEIDRGYMSKALLAEKHLRVIRTLGRDVTESVPLPYSNEDTWRNKIWYHIYIPTRYYIYGTSVTAEFILCPLMKGIEIGKIKLEILERVQLRTENGRFKDYSKDLVVASHEQAMPDNTLPERVETTTGIQDESRHFRVTLPLPKSLNKMRQSVDTDHVKIFHNLKIYVNLHNPDGHVSQLLVRNLLHIFISPNLPVGDDQTIHANEEEVAVASHHHETNTHEAPPTYERHQLDQLYDEIDPSTFLSGANTPYLLSRNPSHENLNSLLDSTTADNTSLNSRTTPVTIGESSTASALQLQHRLAELQGRLEGHSMDEDATNPSPHQSPRLAHRIPHAVSFRRSPRQSSHPSSTSLSALGVSPSHNQFEYFQSLLGTSASQNSSNLPITEYDMEALARIPSYTTALRTPITTPPALSYINLPTYEIAISTPNSPQHYPVQPPSRMHAQNGSRRGSADREHSSRQSSLSGSSDSGSLTGFELNSRKGKDAAAPIAAAVGAGRTSGSTSGSGSTSSLSVAIGGTASHGNLRLQNGR